MGRAPRAFLLAVLAATLFCPGAVHSGEAGDGLLPSPFSKPQVGERLTFRGRWFGIPVGEGWLEVKEIVEIEGRQTYHIEIQGHTNKVLSTFYPIHDIIHSYLDVETLQPVRFEKDQREGNYRAHEVVTFDYAEGTATYTSLLNQSVKTIEIPADVQDLISAIYWFRAQPIRYDEPLTVNIYTDEKVYQTEILVSRPEPLELLKRGTFQCIVVEPKAAFKGLLVKRGRLWAYLTADEHRVPLLVKMTTPWGQMSAVLDEASIPEGVERLD